MIMILDNRSLNNITSTQSIKSILWFHNIIIEHYITFPPT